MVFLLSAASAWKIILPLTNVKRATKKISILLYCISPKGHLLKVAPSGKEEKPSSQETAIRGRWLSYSNLVLLRGLG
jgi:hypothetical protein